MMGASYDLLVENVVENVAVVRMLLSFQQMFLLGGGANRFLGRRRQKSWYDLEKCNVCIWMDGTFLSTFLSRVHDEQE
jgi:hypothetical protein